MAQMTDRSINLYGTLSNAKHKAYMYVQKLPLVNKSENLVFLAIVHGSNVDKDGQADIHHTCICAMDIWPCCDC